MTLTTVPPRAAEWIAAFLNNHEEFSSKFHMPSLVECLTCLSVKELKCISKEIEKQVSIANCSPTSLAVFYTKPTSSSRKAEWVSSIANAFASDDILNIVAPNNAGVATAAAGLSCSSLHGTVQQPSNKNANNQNVGAAVSGASKLSPRSLLHQSTNITDSDRKREKAAAAAEARSPKKLQGKKPSPISKKSSSSAAAALVRTSQISPANGSKQQQHNSTAKKSSAKKRPPNQSSNNPAIESGSTMARRLQQEYMNSSLSSFGGHHGNIPYPYNPTATAASFAVSAYQNQFSGDYPFAAAASFAPPPAANPYAAGTKRPHPTDSTSHTSTYKVKVKKEPRSFTPPTLDDSLQPRDYRESAMVQSLRNMGFTEMREMLSGIRATSAQEVGSVFVPNQWDQTQQVEAAMMWIVNQREEAAEARKLDEARVSSEMADRAMAHSRREEEKRQMKYADLKDLFGSTEGGSATSKHFPSSVLLKNAEVRKVLHAIGIGPGKDQGVKLLQLEGKAIKWYGTVLPVAYFKYVVCPRFEKWSKEFIASSKKLNSASESVLLQKVARESKELEEGMFNLSEQEMGSFGMAPKLFLAAQKDAEVKGKPVCDEFLDDVDLIVVTASSKSSAPRLTTNKRKKAVDIIDLS